MAVLTDSSGGNTDGKLKPKDVLTVEELFDKYHFRIKSYFGKAVRGSEGQDAVEDLAATVFLKAAVAYRNGNGCRDDPERWIFVIAKNVLSEFFRAKKYTTFKSLGTVDDVWPKHSYENEDVWTKQIASPYISPHENAEMQIECKEMDEAIAALPGNQGQIITLRLQGHTNKKIAELLGKSESAVSTSISRSYRHLKKWLAKSVTF